MSIEFKTSGATTVTEQYFQTPFTADFNFSSGDFSGVVRAWADSAPAGGGPGASYTIISALRDFVSGPAGWRWDIDKTSNTTRLISNGNTSVASSTGTITRDRWTSIAFVMDQATNNVDFYFDGIYDSSSTIISQYGAYPIQIGVAQPLSLDIYPTASGGWSGYFDYLKIYNRKLTANEIIAIHNSNGADNIMNGHNIRPLAVGPNGSVITSPKDLSVVQRTFTPYNSPKYFASHNRLSKGVF